MAARAKPPFRADHVGSLLRPRGKAVVLGQQRAKLELIVEVAAEVWGT